MRVLFDGYWLIGGPPSGRNTVRSLISEWSLLYENDVIYVSVRKSDYELAVEEFAKGSENVVPISRGIGTRPHALGAMTLGVRTGLHFDAVLSQNFAPLLASAARGVLVHDALFVDHPEWFTSAELAYFRAIRVGLRRANLIFTTSRTETARIGEAWPETVSRLRTVGLGGSLGVMRAEPIRPSSFGDGLGKYLLTVGRLNIRKNLARLIEAFDSLGPEYSHFKLVIVGARDGRDDLDSETKSHSRVVYTGYLTDAELRWCYENCSLFVFPSMGEGFGLPLLEATALGAICVCSDIEVFRELDVSTGYFDPESVFEIARSIRTSLSCGVEGVPNLEIFGWKDTVQNVRAGFSEMLSGDGK